ncbi:MAG: hypothetical protein ACI9UA_005342 [Pseudoalteromonas tetraodonis]|jgi:hypothetical protein
MVGKECQFAKNLTEKFLTYATGRKMTFCEARMIDAIFGKGLFENQLVGSWAVIGPTAKTELSDRSEF